MIARLKRAVAGLLPPAWQPFALAGARIAKRAAGRVISGPFQGMRYVERSVCSALHPKILGCYELELHELVEDLLKRPFDVLVDVGAAEGYYAVGWACRRPDIAVIAFEAAEEGRAALRTMAAANQVTLRVHGLCDPAALEEALALAAAPLVIMDVEGAEQMLLEPEAVPSLARATILVELHEFVRRGIGAVIKDRFARTHRIREIHSRERTIQDSPVRSPFLDRWLLKHLREFRPEPMQWLLLDPETARGEKNEK